MASPLSKLYSPSPVVSAPAAEEKADDIAKKLTVEVAGRTLSLIEEVVDSFDTYVPSEEKEVGSRQFWKDLIQKFAIPGSLFLVFVGLLIGAASAAVESKLDIANCLNQFEASADSATQLPLLIGNHTRTPLTACRMKGYFEVDSNGERDGHAPWGLSWWRWLFFFAAFFPLGPVSQVAALAITSAAAILFLHGDKAVFVTFGINRNVAWVLHMAAWLGLWVGLTREPLQWGRDARGNPPPSPPIVLHDEFVRVHDWVVRALVVLAILALLMLLRAVLGRYLSLRFHRDNHFENMQRAVVHESVVQALSSPNRLPETTVVMQERGPPVLLHGYDNAHWAALKWVTSLIDSDAAALRSLEGADRSSLHSLKRRAAALQLKLAETISSDLLFANAPTLGEAGGDPDAAAPHPPPDVTVSAEDIVQAVQSQSIRGGGDGSSPNWVALQMRLQKSKFRTDGRPIRSVSEAAQEALEQERRNTLPEEAADAAVLLASSRPLPGASVQKGLLGRFQEVPERKNVSRMHAMAAKLRRAADLASVNALQEHLLSSRFEIFKGSGSAHDVIKDSARARQLGYYIFWNLPHSKSDLAVEEADIKEATARAGIKHPHTVTQLFGRDCDTSATLEQIMTSVQGVFERRESLLRTLQDSESVVKQAERVAGVALVVVWVFVAAFVFNPAAARDSWTALSAGLVSFSFVFGNSIRQLFENAVYLIFAHPFDVGDTIMLDRWRYKVEKISLHYISLMRQDNAQHTLATSEIRTTFVHNITRSRNLWQRISIVVDFDTPLSALETVAAHVHVTMKTNPSLFGGLYRVWLWDSLPSQKIEVAVLFNHAQNGVNWLMLHQTRTMLIASIMQAMQAANVQFTLPRTKEHDGEYQHGSHHHSTVQNPAIRHHANEAAQNLGSEDKVLAAQNILML